MSVKLRQELERRIVGRFVRDALKAGYRLSVSLERGYDIDDMLLGSRSYKAVMDAAFEGDECHIFVHSAEGPTVIDGAIEGKGWVYCVFGNDGYDVISDYTVGVEPLLKGANEIADKYA